MTHLLRDLPLTPMAVLEAEKARLLDAQAVAGVGSWETDFTTLAVTWSDETYRIFEVDRRAWRPSHAAFLQLVHQDDREAVDDAFTSSMGQAGPQRIEHRILVRGGRIRFVEERWQAFFDDRGKPLRAVGTSRDITEQRTAEEAVRLQARMLECIGQAVIATDVEGRVMYANGFAERLYGWGPGEMLGRPILEVTVPATSHEQAVAIMEDLRQGRSWSGEFLVHRRDGTSFPVTTVTSPILDDSGKLTGIIGVSSDISERKAAAQALRASAEEFRTLVEALPQIVWVTRPDGYNVHFNRNWTDYTGLALDESLGYGWLQALHPDERARSEARWREATEKGEGYEVECRLRRRDGMYRWMLGRASPLRDPEGAVVKWFGTLTDIHDLKMAQEELELAVSTRASAERRLLESEEEYRPLFDSNPHAMWVWDAETLAFLAVNDAAVRLYGFSREEFLGMTIKDIRPAAEVPALLDYLLTMPDTPSLPAVLVKHRRKDGSPLEVEGATSPIEFHGRRARLVLAKDVSDKRLLESQLLQAQKMEAVGRLAGGVAHDFNNALGVILGYAELLLRRVTGADRGKLEQIVTAAQRAAGLTRQLLAFSRKQVVEPKVVDLNVLVLDLQTMLGRLLGEDIDLVILPAADLGHVRVDPGQMEQVVLNLSVNARDAMPDGGLLRIETANADREPGRVVGHEAMAPGRYVMLSVSDDGSGIAADLLSKIYEPFFTTKELGKGTGLGLSMVHGIVHQAGGYVWVRSAVGEGSTFTIYLPRIDDPATPPVPAEVSLAPKGWETILLVEDEASLRAIAKEILDEQGYRVLDAGGGVEALGIARHHPDPIHLLVTDVVMPGMNGRVLADSLVAVRPSLQVLFMSGYTNDVIAHRGVLDSGMLFLEKPFSVAALLARVREALDLRKDGSDADQLK